MGVLRRLRARLRPRLRRDEEGFGLLELVVASTVMMSALTSMAYVATNAFGQIGMSRERQTANGLLDEAMEQLRALPYETISLGMRTSDVVGDPRVIGAGTTVSPYRLATNNERIVNVSTNQTVAPLVPNTSTRTIGGTVYTVRVYLSYFQDDPTTGTVTGTAYVDWFSGLQHPSSAFVRTATIIHTTANCTVCPFPGPPLPYFSATSSVKGGRTTIATATATGLTIDSPVASNAAEVAQMATVQGWATTEAATLPSATPATAWGPLSGTSQSDNDPASPNSSPYSTQSGSAAPPGTPPSTSFGPGSLSVAIGAASTYDTVSTTNADATTNVCRNLAGTALNDYLPCDRTLSTAGDTTATLNLDSILGAGLGSMNVLQLGSTSSGVHTHRDIESSGVCSGNGCIHTEASRTISSIKVGAVPPALRPAGFGSLIELSGYSDSVSADSGIIAPAPATSAAGTIKVWNGLTYTTSAFSALTGTTANASLNVTTGAVNITISASLSVGSGTTSSTAATCTGAVACRTRADATQSSPLRGTVTYNIRVLGVVVLSFTENIDMGDLTATAVYREP